MIARLQKRCEHEGPQGKQVQDDMPVALQASMCGIKMSTELFNAEEIGWAKHAEYRRVCLRYRGRELTQRLPFVLGHREGTHVRVHVHGIQQLLATLRPFPILLPPFPILLLLPPCPILLRVLPCAISLLLLSIPTLLPRLLLPHFPIMLVPLRKSFQWRAAPHSRRTEKFV